MGFSLSLSEWNKITFELFDVKHLIYIKTNIVTYIMIKRLIPVWLKVMFFSYDMLLLYLCLLM